MIDDWMKDYKPSPPLIGVEITAESLIEEQRRSKMEVIKSGSRSYVVESDFVHEGLRCVVIFGSAGHRCGYVGVPKGHPLFGKKYDDKFLDYADIREQEIGKRGVIPVICASPGGGNKVSPDVYFNVHGSITYSGASSGKNKAEEVCYYPVKSDLWWWGFDAAHFDDAPDYKRALDYGLIIQRDYILLRRYTPDGEIRNKEYMEQECRSLADQFNVWAKKNLGQLCIKLIKQIDDAREALHEQGNV